VDKIDKPGEWVAAFGDYEFVDELAVALLDRVEVRGPADHAPQVASDEIFGCEDLRSVE
jgi:hypothetical protein